MEPVQVTFGHGLVSFLGVLYGKLTGHSPTIGRRPDSAGEIIPTNAHPVV